MTSDNVHELTWALVVATYNRPDDLRTCVLHAVNQSIPPAEIIVIDASDKWDENKVLVEKDLDIISNSLASRPILRYQPAEIQSAAAQRNQGALLSSSDILFLIDDDTEMYPECAEQVLEVMKHQDASNVLGACTALTDQSPSQVHHVEIKNLSPVNKPKKNEHKGSGHLQNYIINKLRGNYLPEYTKAPFNDTCPSALTAAYGCFSRRAVHGCRMIFRRSVFDTVRFDGDLLKYSYLEDNDFGFRVRQLGFIVEIPNALVFHTESPIGRMRMFITNSLAVSNAMFLSKKHSEYLAGAAAQILVAAATRSILDLAKDFRAKDWKLNRFRGTWHGILQANRVLFCKRGALSEFYRELQCKLFSRS